MGAAKNVLLKLVSKCIFFNLICQSTSFLNWMNRRKRNNPIFVTNSCGHSYVNTEYSERKKPLFRQSLKQYIVETIRNPEKINQLGVFQYGSRVAGNPKILAKELKIKVKSVDRNFRDRGFKKEGRLPLEAIYWYRLLYPGGWHIYRDLEAGARVEDTRKEPKSDNDLINEEDQNSLIEDFDELFNLKTEEFIYLDEDYDDDCLKSEPLEIDSVQFKYPIYNI
ncbi:hypothetical protein M9Y10_017484 [Tritrichomonas musculus]|uniref:Uncharacterized protein n=1 Tax=Tritrichomonas musculus TaxID=1915356 RepID=A0ABR2HUJ0_9EUKA